MLDDGAMPPPPYKLVENEYTWLEETDLVFIDPVDTGYSRATTPELAKEFCGVDKDLESVGEFIRLYLTRYKRWASPLFLVGESYGTFRAAGLAGHLIEKGIAFNGIVLVSSILEHADRPLRRGQRPALHPLPADLRRDRLVPQEAAAGPAERSRCRSCSTRSRRGRQASTRPRWRKGARLQRRRARRRWPTGWRATPACRSATSSSANLRIQIQRFCKELLRDEGRTVGRLDSRYTGYRRRRRGRDRRTSTRA